MRARTAALFFLWSLAAGCAVDESLTASGAMALPETSDHGEFRVRVAPPESAFRRGVNDFSVQATDPAGRPVALSSVRARMPAHNHVSDAPTISAQGDQWAVSNLILWMPGRWEITLRLSRGGLSDDATLMIDVP